MILIVKYKVRAQCNLRVVHAITGLREGSLCSEYARCRRPRPQSSASEVVAAETRVHSENRPGMGTSFSVDLADSCKRGFIYFFNIASSNCNFFSSAVLKMCNFIEFLDSRKRPPNLDRKDGSALEALCRCKQHVDAFKLATW